MFVLLIEGAFEVCNEMASSGMVYVKSFMKIGRGVQAICMKFCMYIKVPKPISMA
jgi:hypothetical protein